jgi:hypothetical protein
VEVDVLDQLQTWWQSVPPEAQALLPTLGIVVVALLGGHFLGSIVARWLRARNFDAALRPPGPAPDKEAERGITATWIAGVLVRLTVWAGAAAWLAHQHGQEELAATLGRAIGRVWALAAVLVAALSLASLVAHRLLDCLQGSGKVGEAFAPRNGTAGSPRGVAGAVGAGVYGLAVLLALLLAADLFDWPLTRSSALALWQIAQNLLIAGAALLIGGLGARWARDLVTLDGPSTPEKRAGQYTGLGIVAATTLLAVAVLLSSAGLAIGLAALAILALLLWMVRGYLPDVIAGFQLRANKVRELVFDGVPWQITEVGLVTTQVCKAGEFHSLQNRLVLETLVHGTPAAASPQ